MKDRAAKLDGDAYDERHRHTNRLAEATSPYLLQHAQERRAAPR